MALAREPAYELPTDKGHPQEVAAWAAEKQADQMLLQRSLEWEKREAAGEQLPVSRRTLTERLRRYSDD